MRQRYRFIVYLSIFLYLLSISLFIMERSFNRERDSLITRYRDFTRQAEEYRAIMASGVIERIEKGKAPEGLSQIMNNLVSSLGLKDRLKSLRATGNRELKDLIEERVEVNINKLTMNEAINLLFGLENHPASLSIKDIRLKKDFEDPERIDLDIKIANYRKRQG